MEFADRADHWIKIKKWDKFKDFVRELKKLRKWRFYYDNKAWQGSFDIVEVSQNIEKSSMDLRRPAVIDSSEIPLANAGEKNSLEVIVIIIKEDKIPIGKILNATMSKKDLNLKYSNMYSWIPLLNFNVYLKIVRVIAFCQNGNSSSCDQVSTVVWVLFTNPSARAGYDTRSIFKRSLTGLKSEFSFS